MKYRVIYERDDDGWLVTIPGRPNGINCHTWGHTIPEARERIREALGACFEDDGTAESAVFIEEGL